MIVRDPSLRKKITFVVLALVLFRLLATIPIPGIDALRLAEFLDGNQLFGLLNVFSGGGLTNLSIVMLGVAPYITASIIMQLLTIMFPGIKAMYHEEGEAGKKKFTMYSRLLTLPLAILQGFALIALLTQQGVIADLSLFTLIVNLTVVTAGSMLLMWIGELISEFGIGNGVSIIIFAGIIAALPGVVQQLIFTFDISQLPTYIGFVFLSLAITAGVVMVTEAERPIPITYAKSARGDRATSGVSTYLPLRVNQAGVIPIIFAISILLFPQMVANFLVNIDNATISAVAHSILVFLENPVLYGATYFALVFFFTYFYTAVTFDPDAMAANLQKGGAFIPGVRPGKTTAEYVARVLNRITLVGATFLGFIAVLPLAVQGATNVTSFAIGGTALLIVVSVAMDLVKKIDAQLAMREY